MKSILLLGYLLTAGERITIDCSAAYEDPREAQCLRVYNLRGGNVLEQEIPAGITYYDVPTSSLAPGMYLFSLSRKNGQVSSCKVIVP